mgnify:CR=1 FL=1
MSKVAYSAFFNTQLDWVLRRALQLLSRWDALGLPVERFDLVLDLPNTFGADAAAGASSHG